MKIRWRVLIARRHQIFARRHFFSKTRHQIIIFTQVVKGQTRATRVRKENRQALLRLSYHHCRLSNQQLRKSSNRLHDSDFFRIFVADKYFS